jgi:tRNA dimethylallyltransferase
MAPRLQQTMTPMATDIPPIAVVGPTGTGKSVIAIELAARLGAEIVSVDSVQVYRGMDIGSAKPSLEERAAARHHMIDMLDPWEECSAGWFRDRAREAIAGVTAAGKPVILVGGSSLYYFATTTELPLYPPSPDVRNHLSGRADEDGLEAIASQLQEIAPSVFRAIDNTNPRRLLRALEISKTRQSLGLGADGWYRGIDHYCRTGYPLIGVGLSVPKDVHKRRIRTRAAQMVAAGLVEEVQALWSDFRRQPAPTAANAIGYRQVRDCLEAGVGSDEMIEAIASATWKLARRQRAWFRRDRRLCWFSSHEPQRLVEAIESYVRSRLESTESGNGSGEQREEIPALVHGR